MLLRIENLLTPDAIAHINHVVDQAAWIDGRVTAGYQSERVKQNLQLSEDSSETHELGEIVLATSGKQPCGVTMTITQVPGIPAPVLYPLQIERGQGL